jgi:RsiW-degrading membrane proteinase PrsW (M82 family)
MVDIAGTTAGRSTTRWMVLVRRWSWLPVLAVGAVLYELTREALQFTGDPLFVPTLILVGAAVVPVAFVAFISGRRFSFGVGPWTVVLTALVGGIVGVLVAGVLEFQALRSLGAAPVILVGLIEELAKLLVPAAVLVLSRRTRRPADGLLLGVACGACFAVLETMGYALVALVRSGGDLTLVNLLLLDRGLLSPAAHMAWTGVAAAALWRAATERRRGRAVVRVLVVYLLVSALHAGWDGTASARAHAGLAVVSLGLLAWTAYRLAGWTAPGAIDPGQGGPRRSAVCRPGTPHRGGRRGHPSSPAPRHGAAGNPRRRIVASSARVRSASAASVTGAGQGGGLWGLLFAS